VDFKLRYQGSVLGYVWSLLRPLLLFMILYLVFTVFLPVGKGVPHYPVYLLLGIVLWNYFAEATSGSVGAIVGRGDLIRKINFPKYNIILAVSFSALINLLLNFVVIAVFMILGHVGITWRVVFMIPLLLELFLVSIGMAFWLSALFVKFRDVSYIWEVAMQAGFYATPIIYPLSRISYHRVREMLLLNPMAQIVQDSRYILVTHSTSTIYQEYGGDRWIWLIPISITLLVVFLGGRYFRRHSKYFAEEV
jgi:ABC-2 type transport system permease protein